MRVLVTGAAGFLGRHLVAGLAHDGYEVIAAVRPATPPPLEGAQTVYLDLAASDFTTRLPQKIDTIVHLAQSRHYRDFPAAAVDIFRINVAATVALLDHAVRFGIRHVVIASSGSVYRPSAAPVAEDAAVAPPDYYASSKLSAELLAAAYADHLALCMFRIFRLYGPGQTNGLIPNLIARIRGDRAVTLAGAEGMRLTPTHVDDAAKIFTAAIMDGWRGTFNLAAPHVITLRHLCDEIGDLVRKAPLFDIAGTASDVIPDITRLMSRYDVKSMKSIDVGLREIC